MKDDRLCFSTSIGRFRMKMKRRKLFSLLMVGVFVFFFGLASLHFSMVQEVARTLDDKPENVRPDHAKTGQAEGMIDLIQNIMSALEILTHPSGYCRRLVDMGRTPCNSMDGVKQMCLDDRLWYSQDKDCLIYSFGIGDDAAFEVSLNKLKPNCEIHMFDSSITEKNVSQIIQLNDHKIFHPLGLYQENVVFEDPSRTFHHQLYSFEAIQDFLEQRNRTLAYLKMDIEGSEWGVLKKLLDTPSKPILSRVRQFSFEIHFNGLLKKAPPSKWISIIQEKLSLLRRLETEAGFRRVSYSPNPTGSCALSVPPEKTSVNLCGEIFYVKTH